jgi:hypothetical protein
MSQAYTGSSIGRTFEVGHPWEPEKVYHMIVLAICGLAATMSLLLRYDGHGLRLFGILWPVRCALYENVGVKCALCGLTRSFCAMGAGELSTAARFHPLGPAIFIFVCLQIPYRIHALWATRTQNKPLRRAGVCVAVGLAAALLINWFVYLGGLLL